MSFVEYAQLPGIQLPKTAGKIQILFIWLQKVLIIVKLIKSFKRKV